MKIYKSQKEVERDVKDNVLTIDGDVKFECSISISASIKVSGNINALDINTWDINAGNIDVRNINALDINVRNINAGNINAWNIDAWNIDAGNINALDIDARNILYYAFCGVYNSIKCLSIKAKREVHSEPICLNGKLEIKKEVETIKIGDQKYNKQEVEELLKNVKSIQ